MHDTALIVALALLAGIVAQAVAQHLRLPGIVLLLAAGVLLGPDGADIIRPAQIGGALQTLVGYAVAIILFEGGMNLNLKRLRRESRTIRRLITSGAIITGLGGAAAARYIMGWEWSLSILFGTLVIVTGPTVITPLLRRIKVKRSVETILEAEGVLIDPIGAIIALVALEAIIHPLKGPLLTSVLSFILRLGAGAVIGFVGGLILSWSLRPRRLIPEGLVNVFVLSSVLALYHLSNAIQPESGIGAVTVAGLAVGNFSNRVMRELMEFKEQLTLLLIGMLFVLLAADVRLVEIQALGWPGVFTVLALMLIVRPLDIIFSTTGSALSRGERFFMAWLGPRGIVAAAVASIFAIALFEAGMPAGTELRAMVFLVIAMTVVVQGTTGGLVARMVGVKRQTNSGFAILGANELARTLGLLLKDSGERVVIVDSNADASNAAEQDGLRVVFGNALEEHIAARAQFEDMAGCIGLTPNEEVNLLFARLAGEDLKVERRYIALNSDKSHVTPDMVDKIGATVLFGNQVDIDLWSVRLRRNQATLETWLLEHDPESPETFFNEDSKAFNRAILPLTYRNGKKMLPVDSAADLKKGINISLLIDERYRTDALAFLSGNGFVRAEETPEKTAQKPV